MSLHQRVSANTGRRTSVSHSVPFVTSDYEQRLLDSLNSAHTELNKTNSERDRYQNLLDQAGKKLVEVNLVNSELKSQVQGHEDVNASLQEKFRLLKVELDRANYENAALARDYAELKAKFGTLTHQYNALTADSSSAFATTGQLPDRPKLSRSSSKKERKEDREERSRNRDKDKQREREKEKEKEREREKEKEREREKEKEKQRKKEDKAEKERLSRRFEERRAAAAHPPPPPASNRRGSFIEGWGPGGRSSSSGSSNRSYTNGATTLGQVPSVVPPHKSAYSSVPRTAANPMTPRLYTGAGSTTAVFDDDGSHEDGNYHAYPISR